MPTEAKGLKTSKSQHVFLDKKIFDTYSNLCSEPKYVEFLQTKCPLRNLHLRFVCLFTSRLVLQS